MNSTREHHSVLSGVYSKSSFTDSALKAPYMAFILTTLFVTKLTEETAFESKGTSNSWEHQQLAKD